MDLFPAIDLRQGRVVRLTRGDDGRRTEYSDDPEAVLAAHAAAGARWVHVVDLDAAMGEPPQRQLLERLLGRADADATVRVQLGGGLRGRDGVAWALGSGASRVVLGSMLQSEPALFAELAREHPDRLVAALDVRRGKVQVDGWRAASERSLLASCSLLAGLPCPAVLVTDIARDGTLAGPNLELARELAHHSGVPALLSGGVRSLADLEAARGVAGIAGAVVGKALYEERFTVRQALAVCAGESAAAQAVAQEAAP